MAALLVVPRLSRAQSATGNTSFDALVMEHLSGFMTRDYWQKPAILLDLMDIQPAEIIADLGCGMGYFTVKLAERVGPDGKVTALDIDNYKLNQLRLIKRYDNLEQIEIVKNNADDIKLAAGSCDKIVLLNTYHELTDFKEVLAQCKKALKPNGKIYIIDKVADKMDTDETKRKKLTKNHFIRRPMVEKELITAGFTLQEGIDKYLKDKKDLSIKKTNWFIVVASVQ